MLSKIFHNIYSSKYSQHHLCLHEIPSWWIPKDMHALEKHTEKVVKRDKKCVGPLAWEVRGEDWILLWGGNEGEDEPLAPLCLALQLWGLFLEELLSSLQVLCLKTESRHHCHCWAFFSNALIHVGGLGLISYAIKFLFFEVGMQRHSPEPYIQGNIEKDLFWVCWQWACKHPLDDKRGVDQGSPSSPSVQSGHNFEWTPAAAQWSCQPRRKSNVGLIYLFLSVSDL